jgi:gamma-glutamyl:cysteine ligase YbdK (ATP-grasp superfamily)
MSASELSDSVARALEIDAETFNATAREEAERLKSEVRSGTFDNTEAIVGMEMELYAVDDQTDSLRRVPRQLLELIGFEKELGLHNAEMQTSPQPLNSHGLAAQRNELKASLMPAQQRVQAEGIRLVSDGMWTVPPTGETAREYLCDFVEEDDVRIGTNMTDAVRYHTMANTRYPSSFRIDAPHVSLQAETVMPESLITSIQPHYQIPHAPDLPEYFRYALRIAAPVLALGVNAPFFPPDLYDSAPDSEIVADAHMENRIGVFESVLNPPEGSSTPPKVCFPPDFDTVEEVIDDIVEDDTIVPRELQSGTRFDDNFVHFRHKHGSYWRWVRPVFEGGTRSDANARIEFRPLPAQPTVNDAIAFEALVAGLLESLPRLEHPIRSLDWETARENFYAATHDGIEADIEWITADGTTTRSTDELYGELFELAREGLEQRGLSTGEARQYIRPLRERADRRLTPARWKHDYVRTRVEDNVPLAEAIWGMQAAYIRNQRDTLLDGSFLDWIE